MDKFSASTTAFFKKVFTYGDRIRPARDWYTLLAVGAILFMLGVGWNIYLFDELASGKSLTSTQAPSQPINLDSSISAVQAVFQKRAAEENNYQNVYHFVDPSLPGS